MADPRLLDALIILRAGVQDKGLALRGKEAQWLDRIDRELDDMPKTESELLAEMTEQRGTEFDAPSYGL